MKWELMRNGALITMMAVTLPGCLMLSALLGASSFVLSGPAQYIGTVYTIGEYTYELAANDKTPDMVIKEKLAWLTGPEVEQAPPALLLAETPPTLVKSKGPLKELKPTALPTPTLSLPTLGQPTAEPPAIKLAALSPVRIQKSKSHSAKKRTPKTLPQKPNNTKSPPQKAEKPKHPTAPKQHFIVQAAEAPPPSRLLKLQRLEQSFHAADQIMTDDVQGNGIRITLPSDSQPSGINGSWSIRHKTYSS